MTMVHRSGQFWTPAEIRYVKANWLDMTDDVIGDHLGRSGLSVASQRRQLGLSKSYDYESVKRIIRDNWGKEYPLKISKMAGVHPSTVYGLAKEMGLPRHGLPKPSNGGSTNAQVDKPGIPKGYEPGYVQWCAHDDTEPPTDPLEMRYIEGMAREGVLRGVR
jgi:hypothetical protein